MMMMIKNNNNLINNHEKDQAVDHDDDDVTLPGFRFHPTDQELLGFYLKRKVENKGMISIELIKHVDIYKYDPWDLPSSGTSNVGDKEWYFYCKRGRKYKNSIRPNRVTASGFWKATGIDRPIFNTTGSGIIIGLKKSLVFYRGSAGKGTKTDWMMHEFRLPSPQYHNNNNNNINHHHQEAEVWTLCRIIKRNNNNNNSKCSIMQPKPCSSSNLELQAAAVPFISFTDPQAKHDHHAKKMKKKHDHNHNHDLMAPTVLENMDSSSSSTTTASNYQNLNNYYYNYINSNTKYGGNWDALSSVDYLESCLASHDVDHPNFLA